MSLCISRTALKKTFVDSGAYDSAIAQKKLERVKQTASAGIFKMEDPPNFQIQVARYQLEKPLATVTPKFDIGDPTFAEIFVVMNIMTAPNFGLTFMRHNNVVIDTRHGLILSSHLTIKTKALRVE